MPKHLTIFHRSSAAACDSRFPSERIEWPYRGPDLHVESAPSRRSTFVSFVRIESIGQGSGRQNVAKMSVTGQCLSRYAPAMRFPCLLPALSLGIACLPLRASQVTGRVTDVLTSDAVVGARVTFFTPDLRLFREIRSAADGAFAFSAVGFGTYRLGVTALGHEYQETNVTVTGLVAAANFILRPETNGGRWTIIGNTEPELLDGSGSGTLLPTGEIFFCHDTEEPILFDPVSGTKWYPPDSLSACRSSQVPPVTPSRAGTE